MRNLRLPLDGISRAVASRMVPVLFFLFWFQQFPVFKSGGSLRLLEIVGFLCVLVWLPGARFSFLRTFAGRCLFALFVLLPFLASVLSVFREVEIFRYLLRWELFDPSFRLDGFASVWYLCLICLLCFFVMCLVFEAFQDRDVARRSLVFFYCGGWVVLLYVGYALIFIRGRGAPDILPPMLDGRNTLPALQFRPGGFSSEPGVLAFTLLLSILLIPAAWRLFDRPALRLFLTGYLLASIGVLALTQSPLVPVLLLTSVLLLYLLGSERIRKAVVLSAFGILVLAFIIYPRYQGFFDRMWNAYYQKVDSFRRSPTHTSDSGAMRRYSSSLGVSIGNDHLLGASGPGRSLFLCHAHEFEPEISFWGERLGPSSPVQNGFVQIYSDLGWIGLLAFFLLLAGMLRLSYRKRKDVPLAFAGFLCAVLLLFGLIAVFPWYFLPFWVPTAGLISLLSANDLASERG